MSKNDELNELHAKCGSLQLSNTFMSDEITRINRILEKRAEVVKLERAGRELRKELETLYRMNPDLKPEPTVPQEMIDANEV